MADGISLLQYTELIGNSLRRHPELNNAWVTAELTDVGVKGGHCYMQLIEKNEAGQTVAKLRATIWASTYTRLRYKFFQATGREIVNGIKVMVCGSASHHSLYGLSFNITDIDPSYTLGDLERLRKEIINRLVKDGVANLNKERPMPLAPQRVAIISSAGAAGYGDFMDQLTGNSEGFVFYPKLFEAVMQGDRTAPTVMAALDRVEMMIDLFDCVVIIRGGGATTDMNGFDDLELARRVCTFSIPVIVGIGHERDRNVLDELACVRCKTPTAVAGYLVDRLRETWALTTRLTNSIVQEVSSRLEGENIRLTQLGGNIPSLAKMIVERESNRLDKFATSLPLAVGNITAKASGRLDTYREILASATRTVITRQTDRLKSFEQLVGVLSPANTLKRGYAIALKDGKAIRKPEEVNPGDEITIRVAEGEFTLNK